MQQQISLTQLIEALRLQLPLLAERYQVTSLGVFGSHVRGEPCACAQSRQRPDSDLDLLVTFQEPPGLFKFIELENYLTDILGVKVDLVMRDTLKPRIGKRILSEAILV
jgi:predicted nucleotidyltransferase